MHQHGADHPQQSRTRGDRLRAFGYELLTLADAVDEPSQCHERAEMLIAEGERIATAIWVVFRGRG